MIMMACSTERSPIGRETDAEDGDRARGLNDERQERGDEEGKSERIPGSFQHFPEPGLLGERCRGVLEEDETEDDQRAPEEGPGHGPGTSTVAR